MDALFYGGSLRAYLREIQSFMPLPAPHPLRLHVWQQGKLCCDAEAKELSIATGIFPASLTL